MGGTKENMSQSHIRARAVSLIYN